MIRQHAGLCRDELTLGAIVRRPCAINGLPGSGLISHFDSGLTKHKPPAWLSCKQDLNDKATEDKHSGAYTAH